MITRFPMRLTRAVLAAGVAVIAALAGDAARAQYYEWETKRPFSGFIGIGPRSIYCDYIRYPKRVCSYDRYGNSHKCRVVGWEIRQHCSY